MDNRILSLKNFLDKSVSGYHAIAALSEELKNAGYSQLSEAQAWELIPGGKYFLTRNGTSLMAFRVPHVAPKGFLMTASHSDRPGFKVKEIGRAHV